MQAGHERCEPRARCPGPVGGGIAAVQRGHRAGDFVRGQPERGVRDRRHRPGAATAGTPHPRVVVLARHRAVQDGLLQPVHGHLQDAVREQYAGRSSYTAPAPAGWHVVRGRVRIGQRALPDGGDPMARPRALQGGERADHAAAGDHGTRHRPTSAPPRCRRRAVQPFSARRLPGPPPSPRPRRPARRPGRSPGRANPAPPVSTADRVPVTSYSVSPHADRDHPARLGAAPARMRAGPPPDCMVKPVNPSTRERKCM